MFGKYKQYILKIETFMGGGRYQHNVFETQHDGSTEGVLSDSVVDALKKVNEVAWEEMPEGSKNLVSCIKYNTPKKKK